MLTVRIQPGTIEGLLGALVDTVETGGRGLDMTGSQRDADGLDGEAPDVTLGDRAVGGYLRYMVFSRHP